MSDLSGGKKRKRWRRNKAGSSQLGGSSLTLAGYSALGDPDEAVLVSYRDKGTVAKRARPPQRTQSMALPQNLQDELKEVLEERSLRPRRAPSAAAEVKAACDNAGLDAGADAPPSTSPWEEE